MVSSSQRKHTGASSRQDRRGPGSESLQAGRGGLGGLSTSCSQTRRQFQSVSPGSQRRLDRPSRRPSAAAAAPYVLVVGDDGPPRTSSADRKSGPGRGSATRRRWRPPCRRRRSRPISLSCVAAAGEHLRSVQRRRYGLAAEYAQFWAAGRPALTGTRGSRSKRRPPGWPLTELRRPRTSSGQATPSGGD